LLLTLSPSGEGVALCLGVFRCCRSCCCRCRRRVKVWRCVSGVFRCCRCRRRAGQGSAPAGAAADLTSPHLT
ncbi:MAG: hypothetical protein IJW99_12410, partial [Clostridia bacterium]|nr:hypothetical protein [Clostridia bacterium]